MALPIFPGIEDCLTILMGELPAGVYSADRADDPNPANRAYSSSELRAQAQMFANLYANLEDIWQDKWISTLNPDGYTSWEKDLFTQPPDASLPLMVRKSNLLAKFRLQASISLPAIAGIVSSFITPYGFTFDILPFNGCNSLDGVNSAWILGFTPLGEFTYLAGLDPLIGAGRGVGITPLDCSLNYAAAGITQAQMIAIQETAYTYAVAIYGGSVSAETLMLLDAALTAAEPARSTHVIINDAIPPLPPNTLDCGPFVADTLMDDIDCGLFTAPPATFNVFDCGGFT
jgi:hypothetical protein